MVSTRSLLLTHYRRADRLMLPLIWGLFIMAMFLAPWYGTWSLVLYLGLPFALVPSALIVLLPGALVTRLSVAASFMLYCALHIHQAFGMAELHFGIFVLLAILLCYRDWVVIVTAACLAAVHHLSFNYLQSLGWNTICFVEPGLGRVVAHAGYVVVETAVLSYIAVWMQRDAIQEIELRNMVRHLAARPDGIINLDVAVSGHRSGGARSLSGALGIIASVVAGVRSGVVLIHDSLRRITDLNMEVRDGTSRQAGMVLEAVTAVQSISAASNVGRDQANGAVGEAQDVTRLAEEGSTAMQESVAMMAAITESSARIADITSVIDGIAFQTNILALNAAVEAARAGQEGRGFAVVATEVRSLAHRSAEAAKEIRALIDASVEQVKTGSTRIETAGQVMEQLRAGISRLATVLAQSRDASEQQGVLITEVGRMVQEISEIAHGNLGAVGLAQQSVQQLEDASTNLVESVQRFSIQSAGMEAEVSSDQSRELPGPVKMLPA